MRTEGCEGHVRVPERNGQRLAARERRARPPDCHLSRVPSDADPGALTLSFPPAMAPIPSRCQFPSTQALERAVNRESSIEL